MKASVGTDLPAGRRPMRLVWRASHGGLVAVVVFSLFVNLLRLTTIFYILQILDRVLASRSIETLIMLAVMALAAALGAAVLQVIRRQLLLQWGAWIETRLGPALFQASLDRQSRPGTGTPKKTLQDLATIRAFVSSSSAEAWLDLPWAPVYVAIIYLIHPLLGHVVVAAILAVLVLGIWHEMTTREARQASGQARSDANAWVAIAELNKETVCSMSMGGNLAERWRRSTVARLDETHRSAMRTATLSVSVQFLRRCLRIAALGVGVWLVLSSMGTMGGIIAANLLGRQAFSLVAKATMKWRKLVEARAAHQRVKAQLARVESPRTSTLDNQLPVALTIEGLTHRYAGRKEFVFRRVNATVAPGEILCVIGRSATGKTTFSRLVTGLVRARLGSVRLGDIDIGRLPPEELSRCVGYLPQDVRLFRGSVRDNIARLGEGSFDDVVEAARLAGIHDTIVRLPEGYDTEIGDDPSLLSGGERKAIALARAFYRWPRLLVLDEPESHFDRPARKVLAQALQTCKAQGAVIIVTSQSRILSKTADKILLLGAAGVELRETKEQVGRVRRRSTSRPPRPRERAA